MRWAGSSPGVTRYTTFATAGPATGPTVRRALEALLGLGQDLAALVGRLLRAAGLEPLGFGLGHA
jgi:hypothetical protein